MVLLHMVVREQRNLWLQIIKTRRFHHDNGTEKEKRLVLISIHEIIAGAIDAIPDLDDIEVQNVVDDHNNIDNTNLVFGMYLMVQVVGLTLEK